MTSSEPEPITWRKSSRSLSGDNNCVEVGLITQHVLVRDSKEPDGGVLRFSTAAWTAFIDMIKANELA